MQFNEIKCGKCDELRMVVVERRLIRSQVGIIEWCRVSKQWIFRPDANEKLTVVYLLEIVTKLNLTQASLPCSTCT